MPELNTKSGTETETQEARFKGNPRFDFSPDLCANCEQQIFCDTEMLNWIGQDLWYSMNGESRTLRCSGGDHVPKRQIPTPKGETRA